MASGTRQPDDDATEPVAVLSQERAGREDGHWECAHRREPYYKPGLDYEDYAPAYCVGYIGHAQYGGRFEDAERSLCANWERIKGDSRLSLDDALKAMRAAWDRMDGQPSAVAVRPSWVVGIIRRRLAMSSFKLSAKLLR